MLNLSCQDSLAVGAVYVKRPPLSKGLPTIGLDQARRRFGANAWRDDFGKILLWPLKYNLMWGWSISVHIQRFLEIIRLIEQRDLATSHQNPV